MVHEISYFDLEILLFMQGRNELYTMADKTYNPTVIYHTNDTAKIHPSSQLNTAQYP